MVSPIRRHHVNTRTEPFKVFVAANPDFADAHFHLALAYDLKGRLSRRTSPLKKPDKNYTALVLEEFKAALGLDPNLWFASYMIAVDSLNNGDFEVAIEYYQRAIQAKADSSIVYDGMARAYYQLGEYGKAIELYNKAITLDEDFAQNHHELGLTYLKQGNRQKAAEQLEILRELNVNFYEALKRAIKDNINER